MSFVNVACVLEKKAENLADHLPEQAAPSIYHARLRGPIAATFWASYGELRKHAAVLAG